MIQSFIKRIASIDRARKRAILVAYDTGAMFVALWAAFSVRLGEFFVPEEPGLVAAAFASVGIGLFLLQRLQVYRIVLRYFDMRSATRLLLGAALAAGIWVLIVYSARLSMDVDGIRIWVPRSVGFIYGGFLFTFLFMGRYMMAHLVREAEGAVPRVAGRDVTRLAIYGANAAGISLAESVRGDPHFALVAFVDDDPALAGQIVAGTMIRPPEALPDLVADGLEQVFLAIPKATRSQRLAAISRLGQLDLKVKTVPAPEEIVSGRFTVSDVRPIDVNDLLRRDPVEPLDALIAEAIGGRTIMITGAGGSIGSEICRQILRGGPRRLVLLDHSEFALYSIEQQLAEQVQTDGTGQVTEMIPVVGSIADARLVRALVRDHGVDTIYHAAAYKHVPLLEHNEVVAAQNNILGTMVLARIAMEERLTRFTMISTDKAVRPESVMGASKRVAELVVQGLAHDNGCPTAFGIVRFGNVLDSSGSVVQRFRNQIRRGGPVTVTDPEVTRFFMSIPEATQLVLQASAMATCGEVFVLDMGEPIRIDDLARHMIGLSGMSVRDAVNPEGDIEIAYVGLRPGEKLYEELFVGDAPLETAHPRIRMARERFLPLDALMPHIADLEKAVADGDGEAVRSILRVLIKADEARLSE